MMMVRESTKAPINPTTEVTRCTLEVRVISIWELLFNLGVRSSEGRSHNNKSYWVITTMPEILIARNHNRSEYNNPLKPMLKT